MIIGRKETNIYLVICLYMYYTKCITLSSLMQLTPKSFIVTVIKIWRHWISEKQINLPKITQLVRHRTKIWVHIYLNWKFCYFHPIILQHEKKTKKLLAFLEVFFPKRHKTLLIGLFWYAIYFFNIFIYLFLIEG